MQCFALPPSGNAVPISRLLRLGGRAGLAGHFGRAAGAFPSRGFAASLAVRWGVPADRLLMAGSGSAALFALLRGLSRLDPGRRAVAIPAWCCPSVPQAVIQAGLVPVPVDLDPSTLGYDPAALLEARDDADANAGGRGLLAVVLVHYFALPQPIPPGDWDGTTFVRDCAQDFDHRPDDGLPCIYSFGRGKALNAGHGGALVIPSGGGLRNACARALAELPENAADPRPMAVAINLLSEPHMYWAVTRIPGLGIGRTGWEELRLDRLSPRFDGVGLASLEAYASCRAFYRRLVASYGALISACDEDMIRIPAPSSTPTPARDGRLPTRFPVLVGDPRLRETLLRDLGGRFGGVTRMYPSILHELPGAPHSLSQGAGFPGSRRIARELLTLPITAGLHGHETPFLECLAEILRKSGALRKRIAAEIPAYETVGAETDWSAVPAPAPDMSEEVLAGDDLDR